jgi:hypothetical protein
MSQLQYVLDFRLAGIQRRRPDKRGMFCHSGSLEGGIKGRSGPGERKSVNQIPVMTRQDGRRCKSVFYTPYGSGREEKLVILKPTETRADPGC